MSNDLKRMIKIEDRILRIAKEDLNLDLCDIEFDIIPPQKMLEIMSYRVPTNISNWKYGRDYERLRTIHENIDAGLPYEVVINSDPARAYLMKSNPFAVQILVMAHVVGHVGFFTMNRHYKNSRQDIIEIMSEAAKRINKYEKMFGLNEIEMTIDAAHALQLHSSPFESETEAEKRIRIFEQTKQELHAGGIAEFNDLSGIGIKQEKIKGDIELFNQKLWRSLKLKTPVEPTEDILRYIIDNSRILEDWQKDILEILRLEGQYYWPTIKTKFMNEGFATYVHEHIMDKLFREDLLGPSDHAQYNFSNALVKAMNPKGMNPYLVGSEIWKNVIKRWDKGRHGSDYNNCMDIKAKKEWDTGDMKGHKKMMEVMKSYTDWFFMQDFLTPELVKDLKLYVYVVRDAGPTIDWVITKHEAKEIRELIVKSFAHSGIPKVEVVNGNFENKGDMHLIHRWAGNDLDKRYAEETMKHIHKLWGRSVKLDTKVGDRDISYIVRTSAGKSTAKKSKYAPSTPFEQDYFLTLEENEE